VVEIYIGNPRGGQYHTNKLITPIRLILLLGVSVSFNGP